MTIPCLGMVSPGLILRALELGAQGIVLISAKEECQLKLDCSNWKGTLQFLQRLLEHWGIEPERVSALDEKNLPQGLPRFSPRIAELKPVALTSSQSKAIPDKGLGLPAAILAMSERLGAQATGRIAAGTVPFGKLALDAAKCTGCAVCVAHCPTDALADLKVAGSFRLVFRQESCVGCGQCVEVTLLFDICGGIPNKKRFKAVQIGGPSGGCLPDQFLQTPIDFDSLSEAGAMMGSGGMVVMDEDTCMVDVARYFLDFTQKESCGKCTFCRIGTKQVLRILERITRGEGREGDLEQLETLSRDIKNGSLCGLGKTAPNPVITSLRYFRDEYEAHQGQALPFRNVPDPDRLLH